MKELKLNELVRMIDISAVQTDSTLEEVKSVIDAAKKYNFVCVFVMPSMLHYAFDSLKGYDNVGIGGIVGFPSGAETTDMKIYQAEQYKKYGCKEVDMVMNIGKLKSGLYDDVMDDIMKVKQAVFPLPLKVIIEVALLNDDEIKKAAELVLNSGADFVKTGTGWKGSTTMHHVNLIKSVVGEKIKLKVAGGVRTLETLEEMYNAGVCRFGIGYKSALGIVEECNNRENG